ncbi:isochorismatase family cysteine hydrolase [Streptomyces xinghaiensis]|uniref:Cysteine hydrolase n=2 Tax=Streptomyces TaxID=1883 RepID=A0A420UXM1_9ACTN|nr:MULTISPECIES: isochorismatase family cysteine hydrolase [Streptomyces]KNE83370.1 hydrolase [Streptomyces fradiae]OFA34144.1 hydrolase [Streptomyces fradiae]PQM20541.1 cysteine hydrolase [Streptomyces xinghaiensis]RKM92483.1 cysteine hydrolase [Streptomyces xinghaiensis]RNC70450.1 cysteine hydrolase [Streptomyces xinghaiensis]
MNPHSTALLVIDVQRGFINQHSRRVLPAIVQLVERWRATGAPMVLTRFHNEPGSPYETITGWTRLRTAKEQALVEELAPFTDSAVTVIDKAQSSVFTPEGAQLIRDQGWSDLVLCGIDTDACVYDSAVAAYQSGYRPWIVTDACASTGGPEYHDAALLLAARNLGADQLVTSETILTRIGRQGAHT